MNVRGLVAGNMPMMRRSEVVKLHGEMVRGVVATKHSDDVKICHRYPLRSCKELYLEMTWRADLILAKKWGVIAGNNGDGERSSRR